MSAPTEAKMRTSEILGRAADHLIQYGWIQGGFAAYAGNGRSVRHLPCDALGAIGVSAHGRPWHLKGAEAAVEALAGHLQVAPSVPDIARWNDAPGRTQTQAVDALRAAAASEREQGR